MYPSDEETTGLDALTTLASNDLIVVGDVSDANRSAKTITKADLITDITPDIISEIISTEGGLVNSVTGLDTDNTDPQNPIVKIAVDGASILGDGTPGNPLYSIGGGGGGGTKLVINTTAGNTYTVPIPGGILGTNNAIKFTLVVDSNGYSFGNSSTDHIDIVADYGGQTVTLTVNKHGGVINFPAPNIEGLIVANGATNSQKASLNAPIANDSGPVSTYISIDQGINDSMTVDSTVSHNLVITVVAPGAGSVAFSKIIVERISTSNVLYASGVATRLGNAITGNQVIAHGLSSLPEKVKITCYAASGSSGGGGTAESTGSYIVSSNTMTAIYMSTDAGADATAATTTSEVASVDFNGNHADSQTATITVDATNITLAWTKNGSGSDNIKILWEAQA